MKKKVANLVRIDPEEMIQSDFRKLFYMDTEHKLIVDDTANMKDLD